jgi:hypothetical protein
VGSLFAAPPLPTGIAIRMAEPRARIHGELRLLTYSLLPFVAIMSQFIGCSPAPPRIVLAGHFFWRESDSDDEAHAASTDLA